MIFHSGPSPVRVRHCGTEHSLVRCQYCEQKTEEKQGKTETQWNPPVFLQPVNFEKDKGKPPVCQGGQFLAFETIHFTLLYEVA